MCEVMTEAAKAAHTTAASDGQSKCDKRDGILECLNNTSCLLLFYLNTVLFYFGSGLSGVPVFPLQFIWLVCPTIIWRPTAAQTTSTSKARSKYDKQTERSMEG